MSSAPDYKVLATSEILLHYNHSALCRFQGYSVIFMVDVKAGWLSPRGEIMSDILNLDS